MVIIFIISFYILLYISINILLSLLNDTISNINSTTVKLSTSNTTSDSIAFGIDSNSNYGYIKTGADTVIPFKNNWKAVIKITFGVAAQAQLPTAATDSPNGWCGTLSPTITYIDGVFTITPLYGTGSRFTAQTIIYNSYISNITVTSFEWL